MLLCFVLQQPSTCREFPPFPIWMTPNFWIEIIPQELSAGEMKFAPPVTLVCPEGDQQGDSKGSSGEGQ